MEEEYAVVCVCGLTTYRLHVVADPEEKGHAKKIVARCTQCGRIRFVFQQEDGDHWFLYDRVPFQ